MIKTSLTAVIIGGAILACAPAVADTCTSNPPSGATLHNLQVPQSATCILTDATVVGGADISGNLIVTNSTMNGGTIIEVGGGLVADAGGSTRSTFDGGITGWILTRSATPGTLGLTKERSDFPSLSAAFRCISRCEGGSEERKIEEAQSAGVLHLASEFRLLIILANCLCSTRRSTGN